MFNSQNGAQQWETILKENLNVTNEEKLNWCNYALMMCMVRHLRAEKSVSFRLRYVRGANAFPVREGS